MMGIIEILVLWFLLSIPVSLIVGYLLSEGKRAYQPVAERAIFSTNN